MAAADLICTYIFILPLKQYGYAPVLHIKVSNIALSICSEQIFNEIV